MKGGTILLTAKNVIEKKEAVFTFRVHIRTKEGPRLSTLRYNVLLYPAAPESIPPSEQQGDMHAVRAHAEELAIRASKWFDELQRCNPIGTHLEERTRRISDRSPEAQALTLRAWRAAIAYNWCHHKILAAPTAVRHDLRPMAGEKAPELAHEKSGGSATTTTPTQAVAPISPVPSPLRATVEEGYRIEEGFFDVKIRGTPFLLQGLIVRKADGVGRLPIMLYTHGVTPSMNQRQEMTPRGVKDANLRLVRDYARRGWLAVFVLRRAYGQSDGPDPVMGFKCDSTTPSFQEGMDWAADDLEATLNYMGRRVDADTSRMVILGVSGGGAAAVALGARNIPGLKLVVNVSGGLSLINCAKNSERLVEAMRYFGAKSRVPNLWYYVKNDSIFPEETVVKMRAAFLEGGAYAKLLHYPKLTVPDAENIDGHNLWSKMRPTVMLDVDGYLHTHDLPTWDFTDAKTFTGKLDLKATALPFIELYLAAPGHKALARSTTNESFLADTYNADTLEHAKQGAVAACEKRYSGHTCKIIDPPERRGAEAGHDAVTPRAKIGLATDMNMPARTGTTSSSQPNTAESAGARRKLLRKVKSLSKRATPPSGSCTGVGAVKTEGGKCLRWITR
jgi:dienelactone hydrolase